MPTIIALLAFGYFVDLLDAGILASVRVASLRDLGVAPGELLNKGVFLYNMQLAGMLLGGVGWGILGDKFGRTLVFFGAIATYALANLANVFVTSVEVYGVLRLIGGFGLAGELGGAVTFLSEVLAREQRGFGTSLVIAFGGLGSISAGFIADQLPWRHCYLVGGLLGLSLLLSRFVLVETSVFRKMAMTTRTAERGSLSMMLGSPERRKLFFLNATLGLPIYFLVTVLIVFLPELTAPLGVTGEVTVGRASMFHYSGKALGSLLTGVLSRKLGSHKRVIEMALVGMGLGVSLFLCARGLTPAMVYGFFFGIGLTGGYWGIYMVMLSEQFGTNLRSTVMGSVASIVRGGAILMTSFLQAGHEAIGVSWLMLAEGLGVVLVSLVCLQRIKEDYGRDVDFVERRV